MILFFVLEIIKPFTTFVKELVVSMPIVYVVLIEATFLKEIHMTFEEVLDINNIRLLYESKISVKPTKGVDGISPSTFRTDTEFAIIQRKCLNDSYNFSFYLEKPNIRPSGKRHPSHGRRENICPGVQPEKRTDSFPKLLHKDIVAHIFAIGWGNKHW